jgi:hypothetical protein
MLHPRNFLLLISISMSTSGSLCVHVPTILLPTRHELRENGHLNMTCYSRHRQDHVRIATLSHARFDSRWVIRPHIALRAASVWSCDGSNASYQLLISTVQLDAYARAASYRIIHSRVSLGAFNATTLIDALETQYIYACLSLCTTAAVLSLPRT